MRWPEWRDEIPLGGDVHETQLRGGSPLWLLSGRTFWDQEVVTNSQAAVVRTFIPPFGRVLLAGALIFYGVAAILFLAGFALGVASGQIGFVAVVLFVGIPVAALFYSGILHAYGERLHKHQVEHVRSRIAESGAAYA